MCPKRACSSPAPWPATCATAKRTPPARSCRRPLPPPRAADFVNAMDEGVDSPISQGGTNVSGGQRQRLSIARALARKAPIYIFGRQLLRPGL